MHDPRAIELGGWLAAQSERRIARALSDGDGVLLSADPRVVLIDRVLTDRWVARMADRVQRAPTRTARILAAVRVLRDVFVNQRELGRAHGLPLRHPGFGTIRFARLLVGQTDCAGQNELLSRLLVSIGVEHDLFRTRDRRTGWDDHVLVRAGDCFIDAWSDVPMFRLREGIEVIDAVPSLGRVLAEGATEACGLFTREEYARGRSVCRVRASSSLASLAEMLPLRQRPVEPYLRARLQHLFGEPREARSTYREVTSDFAPFAALHAARLAREAEQEGHV